MMTSTRHRKNWIAAFAALAIMFLSGCAEDAPQDALEPEGEYARLLDRLWDPVFGMAVFVFILVEGLILFTVIRYRSRSVDDAPVQTHGNAKFEIGWSIFPAIILSVVAVFTLGTIVDLQDRPENAVEVNVTGHQWWWEYEYPELGITTANELVIPAGRPVNLKMTADDVIHSFWVPKLAGKLDVIPGRTTRLSLAADRPGKYAGQCAEFCGESHANMRLSVHALNAEGFDEWVSSQRQSPPVPVVGQAAAGHELFLSRGCAGCHTVKGVSVGEVGPDLTHLQSRDEFAGSTIELNDRNMRRWLRDPPAEKPGSRMPNLQLTEDEITKLLAYLRVLK